MHGGKLTHGLKRHVRGFLFRPNDTRRFLMRLPDLVEKLPGVGFIAERPFGIISTVMKPVEHEYW